MTGKPYTVIAANKAVMVVLNNFNDLETAKARADLMPSLGKDGAVWVEDDDGNVIYGEKNIAD